VDGAARQPRVDTAPHRLGDVVERQGEAAAQLDHQGFFPLRQTDVEAMRPGRTVDDVRAGFPARHGAAVDAELAGQHGVAGLALLDVGAATRCGGGVGCRRKCISRHSPGSACCGGVVASGRRSPPVGPQEPSGRRAARAAMVAARSRGSLLWTTGTSGAASRIRRCRFSHSTACHNRAPSCQSSGTKHLRRGRLVWGDGCQARVVGRQWMKQKRMG
jgi:hypothetical protein